MGLSGDQDGIMERYINEEGYWNEHLNNSKGFIQRVVEEIKPKSIAVLGSGWLLDVPVEFLLDNCERIFFYDIRHPRPIVHRYAKIDKIEFVNMDITGGAIQYIYEQIKAKKYMEITDVPECGFQPVQPVDLVISLNVLNQLDILIVEYLRRFSKVLSDDVLLLRKKIQLAHLNSLLADTSCLISDFEESLYDRTGSLVEKRSLVFTCLPEGKYNEEWIWKFDNRMTYYPNRTTHFKVKAVRL